MSAFSDALKELYVLEGGLNRIAGDKGGETAFGISLRFLRGLPKLAGDVNGDGQVNADDIRSLTPGTAEPFYRQYFWDQYGCGQIDDESLAIRVFTLYVNARPSDAGHVFQRALRSCGVSVMQDGVLGPKTRSAINGCNPTRYLAAVRSEQAGLYRLIVAHDPTQQKFLTGWLNRAYRQ